MLVRFSTALAIVFCAALPLRAQDGEAPSNLSAPVSLTYVDGDVQYLNAGAAERADAPSMLNDGDGLRTGRGRAELVFGDGSVLHLDENTAVDVLEDRRLRVLGGRVVLRASAAAADGYIIDTPAASVRVESRGEYDLFVDGRRQSVDVAVARGVAEVAMPSEDVVVRAGEQARLDRPGNRPLISAFNSARLDAFGRWSLTRYEGEALSDTSRRLPTELRAYGETFDRHGRWDYVEPYGQVWYPAAAPGWRPYYNGGWRHTRYGWTWFGADPWAWPTHHYGRWQFAGSAWFWIPTRVWGPAWVSWAYAPGYVSWAPLGWDSRPVVPFYLRVGHVNPHRWRAWTVLPRPYLGRRGHIQRWVVDAHRAPAVSRAVFVQRARPAERPPVHAVRRAAVARSSSAAPRASVDRAVPRGSAAPRGSAVEGGRATRSGSAAAPRAAVTNAERRNPSATPAPQRGPSRSSQEQPPSMARPRSTARPAAQPAPSPQNRKTRGTIRRQDSPAYAPSTAAPQSRPRPTAQRPSNAPRGNGGAVRRGEARAPRPAPRPAPRAERPAAAPSPSSAPRTQSARPRGEPSRGGAGRGASQRGAGSSKGKGSSGERSGGAARRPPPR